MSSKSRIAITVVVVLLLAAGGAIFYINSNLDRIVARLIEQQGSEVTQTPVRVGGVAIRLKDATGTVSNLRIDNPPGFDGGPALQFGKLTLNLDAGTLFSDPVVVEEIAVDSARLRVQQQGRSNNLRALLDAVRQSGAASGGDDPSTAAPLVIIKRFVLSDAVAELSIADLDRRREVEIPQIVITDIGGSSNGATATQVARQVLEPVLQKALESAAVQSAEQELRERIDEKAGEIGRGLLDRLGGDDDGKPDVVNPE